MDRVFSFKLSSNWKVLNAAFWPSRRFERRLLLDPTCASSELIAATCAAGPVGRMKGTNNVGVEKIKTERSKESVRCCVKPVYISLTGRKRIEKITKYAASHKAKIIQSFLPNSFSSERNPLTRAHFQPFW